MILAERIAKSRDGYVAKDAGFERVHPRDDHGRFAHVPGIPLHPDEAIRNKMSPISGRSERDVPPAPFTKEDKWALQKYMGHDNSYFINKLLRTGHSEYVEGNPRRIVHDIDRAMRRAGPIGKPVRAYRGIWNGPEKVGLPRDPSKLVGKSFHDKGYGSTAGDPRAAFGWLGIAVQQGTDVMKFTLNIDPRVKAIWGANPTEDELLLQRGVTYTIEKVTANDIKNGAKIWEIEAKVTP